MQEANVIRSFCALAHEARLRVFRALVVAGPEGLTPSALAEQLDIAPNALSFHLKELSIAGLIEGEPSSRYIRYRADFEVMNALVEFLTHNCCGGGSSLVCVPNKKATAAKKAPVKAARQ